MAKQISCTNNIIFVRCKICCMMALYWKSDQMHKKMKKMILATIAVMALTALTSCHGNLDREEDNSYKPLSLTTRGAEYAAMGSSFSTTFIDKVQAVAETDYIISPLSMQFLLGMILDGAQGETADEICRTLGYGQGEIKEVNEYCRQMLAQLPGLDKKTKLTIANAIVVDKGYPLLDQYKKDVTRYYDAEVSNLDFSQRKASADKINEWCSDHTEGLIPEILKETSPDMLAYLLNAMYFKSKWSSPFHKDATWKEDFHFGNGTTDKVQMMKAMREIRYQSGKMWTAVSLPYGNGSFSMNVFLPAEGKTVSDVTAALAAGDWNSVRSDFRYCKVDLWLPRFETAYHITLNDILSGMGMPSAFDSAKADFKAMSQFALCLSFVNQDAVIKVDEEGTEAAVVSSAGMEKATAVPNPEPPIIFHADKPFLYIISEKSTGAILFAGRYGGNQ